MAHRSFSLTERDDLLNDRIDRDNHREPGPRITRPALTSRGTLRSLIERADAARGRA